MKKLAIIMVLALTLTVGLVYALGEPGGATAGAVTDEGSYLAEDNDTVDVNGSQIYTFDLSSDVSTVRWAGITGTLSGSLVLGDDDELTMFEWVGEGLMVYAAEALVTWANLEDAVEAEVVVEYPHISDAQATNDAYSDTFLGASENITSNIFEINSDYAITEDGTSADLWKTYSLRDNVSDTIVFAGLADTGTNYKGVASEYQMILPEDETSGDEGVASTYYLWVELE